MAPKKSRISATEWLGFDGNEYHQPKSFGDLDEGRQALACEGLTLLMSSTSSLSNGVEITKPTSIDSNHLFFETLILATAIERLSEKLKLVGKPAYLHRTASLTRVRGRIDFAKTIVKSGGVHNKHVCTFPELSYEDEVLQFAKFAATFALSRALGRYAGTLARAIKPKVNLINSLLPNTSAPPDLVETAARIVYASERLNQKYRNLFPECGLLAHFVLSSAVGMTTEEGLRKLDGLLINMNRPFEKLILWALESTGKFTHQTHNELPLNRIDFVDSRGQLNHAFTMKPDCKGWLRLDSGKVFLIADAKHKLMSQDLEEDEMNENIGSLNRNDFYQIISYGTTSSQVGAKSVFCLIGLNAEKEESEVWVKRLPMVRISFGNKKFDIQRLTVSFGSVLIELGRCMKEGKHFDSILTKLGNLLIAGFVEGGPMEGRK